MTLIHRKYHKRYRSVKENAGKTVYNILVDDEFDPREAIINTSVENLDLIPASVDLAGAEVELVQIDGREKALKTDLIR